MQTQNTTQNITQKEIMNKMEFPVVIDDDFDTITVTITRIPTMTHAPDSVKHDDGFGELFVILISNWGEEPIEYEKYLCRVKKVEILEWDKGEQIRDKYMTVAITTDEYVAMRDNEILYAIFLPNLDKYIILFFEIID